MRKLLPLALLACVAGCQSSTQTRRIETPVNVTHEVAFGDYRRVFNTTYHIVNRYGVVQNSSYRYGEITALVSEDTSLWDKTRKTIQARIVDAGDFWDVQCRVLVAIEDSEVATFPDQFQPLYSWKTVASDPQLEVRLNNEIRAALSGGAWQAKEPLTPKPRVPETAPPARQPKEPASGAKSDDGEVSAGREPRLAGSQGATPGADAYERLGVSRMRRGSYDGAARAFRAAVNASGEAAPFAHFLLAQALYSQGEFDEATQSLEQGALVNPDWTRADLDLRELYPEGATTFAERLTELQRAAQADGDLELLLGYMRLFSGDAEGALEALDRHLREHPEHLVASAYRAQARRQVDLAHGLEDF